MLNIKVINAKTEDEAIKKYIEENNCNRNDFIYKNEVKEKGKLFKSEYLEVSFISKKDIIEYIENYFKELGNKMNIEISASVTLENDNFNVMLVSSNNSILIGKEGKNLNALQTMIRQSIYSKIHLKAKINVDVENYRFDKLKYLDKEIENIVNEVIETKLDVYLDPMNAYERRYVHNLVASFKNVTTESIGEGIERRIIIKYVEE